MSDTQLNPVSADGEPLARFDSLVTHLLDGSKVAQLVNYRLTTAMLVLSYLYVAEMYPSK